MIRACGFLLAGVYALQFGNSGAVAALCVTAFIAGRLRAVACAAIGALLFYASATPVIDARIAPLHVGDSIMTDVRVADFPQRRGATTTFLAQVADSPWVPERIRVSWFEPPRDVAFGDVWRLELRLRRPRGTRNPGVFDYESWLFRERVGATAYVVESRRNRLLGAAGLGVVDGFRQRAVAAITTAVGDSERAAVLAAITVGARHGVTAEQWNRYARTGTSHLMAISGLHVGLAAAAGYYLVLFMAGALLRHHSPRRAATMAALLVAVCYATVSGLAVPAQRATLMIALAAMALLRRRQVQPFSVIATTCVLMTVLDPLATMAPGFKLSFLAVVVLLLLARRQRPRRMLAIAQMHLFFGLLPLLAILFGRVALAAPVVNLLAVPVFSFVTVPFALAGLFGGEWLLKIAALSLDAIEWLIAVTAQTDHAAVGISRLDGAARPLLLAPLLFVLLPCGWPGRWIAWPALLALLTTVPSRAPVHCIDIDVLDVGQGLAVVAATGNRTMLYDTGPAFRGGGSAAETVLLPYFASRGIDTIDTIVVSHADLDHAGGIDAVRAATMPANLFVGEALAAHPAGRPCNAGQRWRSDGVEFEFLWPPAGALRHGNDASCVLQIGVGEHRLLIAGDIEAGAEHELLRLGSVQKVSAVVVPHHGSATSSTQAFVARLQPQLAVVSAGFGNRWGLPDDTVVQRWRDVGAQVISTAESGAVSLRVCKHRGIVSLQREREHRRRLWHE